MRVLRPGILFCMLISIVCCKKQVELDEKSNKELRVNLISNPSPPNSVVPRLFSNGEELYMSWVTKEDSISVLRYAVYDKKNWSEIADVAAGSDWFVNWADFPVIAESDDNLIVTYLEKSSPETFSYDIIVHHKKPLDSKNRQHVSPDLYEERNFKLHNDTTRTEHGFVSVTPSNDGAFFISWLDGRRTGAGPHGHNSKQGGPMTLRGALITSNGEVIKRTELDGRVCDCCQTSAAMTNLGPIVAYRDRSEQEIRDVGVIRQVRGKWLPSQIIWKDRWEISGCPVNGPAISTFDQAVGLAWFTAAGGEGKVQLAFSEDDGENFADPIRLDAGNATGRVDVEMLNKHEAAVIWMEPKGDEEYIQLVKVNTDGSRSGTITVSKTSPARASGFPQLEKLDDRLVLAWTVAGEDVSTIKTAEILINKIQP